MTKQPKQPATFTLAQMPGESADNHMKRVRSILRGDDVRVKGDLKPWTGVPRFSIGSRDPVVTTKKSNGVYGRNDKNKEVKQ